nr:MAG TPA: hypothetical protein [Caudoviricetes sp.]
MIRYINLPLWPRGRACCRDGGHVRGITLGLTIFV